MTEVIHIARDFSRYPGGRYKKDGPRSGQEFREDYLIPALKKGAVVVVLDDVAGLPSSFLEEAIGGLIRAGISLKELNDKLSFEAHTQRMTGYINQAKKYLVDAQEVIENKKS